jgi:plasmid stabilization system protein ParE
VEVLFTPSARTQLLAHVAALRHADRGRAARFVDALEARLEDLSTGAEAGRAIHLLDRRTGDADGVRLGYWVRAGVLWILAIHPEATNAE